VAGMDKNMKRTTRVQVLEKLRRRYTTAGAEHGGKLLDQAAQLLGYHRKAAIRALRRRGVVGGPLVITGRCWSIRFTFAGAIAPRASPDTAMSSVSRAGAITIPLAFSLNRWPNRGRERPEMNVMNVIQLT